MKVFWLFNHPAPYKVDFFNELGKFVELDVYFERSSEKSRGKDFYSADATSFSCHICFSFSWGEGNNFTKEPLKALKDNHYDLIVINGWRTYTEQKAISYCRRHKLPYVFWINGGIIKPNESKFSRLIKTHFIKGADLYFSPDEKGGEYLVHYGAPSNKIVLYPYSTIFEKEVLKAPLSQEEKQNLRRELELQGERIYISAGQFIERKNYKELIRLWAKMDHSDSLYLLGDGVQKQEYEKLIKALHLDNVFILPFKKHGEMIRYFQAADCFVFLSKEDIYGHVINEALSQALPVLSSKGVNAACHLIKNGENGYLVDLGKDDEIVALLRGFPKKDMEIAALKTAEGNTIEKSVSCFVDYFLHKEQEA